MNASTWFFGTRFYFSVGKKFIVDTDKPQAVRIELVYLLKLNCWVSNVAICVVGPRFFFFPEKEQWESFMFLG